MQRILEVVFLWLRKKMFPRRIIITMDIEVEIEQKDLLKYEIADELGVLDRAMEKGWKSLSAKETGKIGGLISRRKREETKWIMNFMCK